MGKTLKLAISSILSNKMRSFLTMLGIIIGVAAVIILVSIMDGVTGQVTDTFESIGMNNLSVMVTSRGSTRAIEPEDMYALLDEHSDTFSYISPNVTLNAVIKAPTETDSDTGSVTGVDETYDEIKRLTVEQGRFLQYVDVSKMLKVCVIGTYYEQEYYGRGKALGETIRINGQPYTIVGVFEEQADSAENSSDQCLYIPYTNASKMSWNTTISSYTAYVTNTDDIDKATSIIKQKATELLGSSDNVTVIATKEILDEVSSITDTLKMALVCIAGISLLVGGIGIMNIMLVSVTERTREIGIRKSLGAKKKHIMSQFVFEAGTVSGLGGILGIVAGIIFSTVAGKLLGLSVVASPGAIVVAFSVSVAIGVIFGFLPAKNAANLNPIDALRFE
ncbi:MAG: ABC transporter permease [Clostridia bacterium]|nr:ABC transporter permease [Clostridia bacterium]